MERFSLLIWMLAAEVLIVIALFVGISLHRTYTALLTQTRAQRTALLGYYFLSLLEEKKPYEPHPLFARSGWRKSLLEVLESYNRRLKGDEWSQVREAAVEDLLLPRARRWARSLFWRRRNFAARTFALCPRAADEAPILNLMRDSHFLVRSVASLAAVRLEDRTGIELILRAMSAEPGYALYFYRDVLLQGSRNVFVLVVELASQPALHLACLDLLAAQSWGIPIPFLKDDLVSPHPRTRHLALKILIRNPLPDSAPVFLQAASDPDPYVRATAMNGLLLFPSDETLVVLEKGLSDPIWDVRVEAGRTLKRRGEQGLAILARQTTEPAHSAAHYAQVFG